MKEGKKKVAVVGSGIAGLAALYTLQQDGIEVELYEKEDRIGGDAHTIEYKREGKAPCWVETAFLLLHRPGWPNFFAFLESLGVELQPSTASLSITSRDLSEGEEWGWASTSLFTFFPCWSDLLDGSRYRLLYDILRFNLTALEVLRPGPSAVELEVTVADYLGQQGYSSVFRDRYLLPLFSCIHSIPLSASAQFPIICLVQMFHNLRLLQLWGKPRWYVIKGGSQRYVQAITATIPTERLHPSAEVVSVSASSDKQGATLTLLTGEKKDYDHVILATHSDVTRRLLERGDLLDRQLDGLLKSWEWVECEMHVHHDESAMPMTRRLHAGQSSQWSGRSKADSSAWNGQVTSDHISATFDMNLLLSLPSSIHGRILTTLNPHPSFPVDKAKVISTQRYAQPILSPSIVRSQIRLARLQGQPSRYPSLPTLGSKEKEGEGTGVTAIREGKVIIAGAWTGRGIHEDGYVSGVRAAERAGARTRTLVPSDRAVTEPEPGEGVIRGVLSSIGWLCGWRQP